MTGLDKIIAQIKLDSDNACADIKNRTDEKCHSIIAEAEQKAEQIISEGKLNAENRADDIIERAKSSSELNTRSMLLEAKQGCIASALDKARQYLISLPDEEYFSLLLRMVLKFNEEADGVICFSEKDLARIPSGFERELKKVSRGELVLSSEPADIDGGFILLYGGIEVNCAFKSIFSAESERFSDEVLKILFL